jgi:protein SCO1/2
MKPRYTREDANMPFGKMKVSLVYIIFLVLCCSNRSEAVEQKYKRTVENYTIPDVVLVDQNGTKVRLKEMLQSNKPVIVDFIFGTCTTICPILSAGFVNLQNKLGADAQKVHLVSISIDPENDTSKVMKDYLKRYRAKPGWDFYTGSRKDIDSVMKAFDAYIPNKMSHYPLILIRPPADGKWVRIFGLLSSSEFVGECQKVGIK